MRIRRYPSPIPGPAGPVSVPAGFVESVSIVFRWNARVLNKAKNVRVMRVKESVNETSGRVVERMTDCVWSCWRGRVLFLRYLTLRVPCVDGRRQKSRRLLYCTVVLLCNTSDLLRFNFQGQSKSSRLTPRRRMHPLPLEFKSIEYIRMPVLYGHSPGLMAHHPLVSQLLKSPSPWGSRWVTETPSQTLFSSFLQDLSFACRWSFVSSEMKVSPALSSSTPLRRTWALTVTQYTSSRWTPAVKRVALPQRLCQRGWVHSTHQGFWVSWGPSRLAMPILLLLGGWGIEISRTT